MASVYNRVSSGLKALDEIVDEYRLGDNVVWQVDSIEDYKYFVDPYVKQSLDDGRNVIYIRFGSNKPLVDDPRIKVYIPRSHEGFEHFASELYNIITKEGRRAFYVFDCLTEILDDWCSDLMIGNFFRITCPYLFELDTIAYFSILRGRHSVDTIARIRETTQILIDVYSINSNIYVHPLKVWERYSPTMFLPHKFEVKVNSFVPLTGSIETAKLFSKRINEQRSFRQIDYWDRLFMVAQQLTDNDEKGKMFNKLLNILIGKDSKMIELAKKYFTLDDLIEINNRQIGTGYIGGKSVGMLLSRKILESEKEYSWTDVLEQHDSYYLGSDIFYTYLVQNGLWKIRMLQKKEEGYIKYADELRERLKTGAFPAAVREQFQQMLEYFGQSPIIVRSSSLLEDNFGNAFAGKYESVFCVNQGTPEQRYANFEEAVRTVYASMMSKDALNYRIKRGLWNKDEQMALLVQRVSGNDHKNFYFPNLAGVGNSSNLYVWDKTIDPTAGMLRLVFGLGTRAVERADGDYPKIVCLDKPTLSSVAHEDIKQFSQHNADVLDLLTNEFKTVSLIDLLFDIDINMSWYGNDDFDAAKHLAALKIPQKRPFIMTFDKLLKESNFPKLMRDMLSNLEKAYNYPVDIEYTVNFINEEEFKINLLQCRPLQTRGLGHSVKFPDNVSKENVLFSLSGNFMGGNVRLPISRIIYVDPKEYSELPEREKYSVARTVGKLNKLSDAETCPTLLIGPGRWGTTTPSLGVPINFAEINNVSVLGEVAFGEAAPELSYGSHFFQDLVESSIFYIALFPEKQDVIFSEKVIYTLPNILGDLIDDKKYENVIRICDISSLGFEVYSDIVSQRCICIRRT